MGELVGFVGAKGGVGTTLVTIMAGARAQLDGHQAFLVDMTGDISVVLDTRGAAPGLSEVVTGQLPAAELRGVRAEPSGGVRVLPKGDAELTGDDSEDWDRLWSELRSRPGRFLIDAGRGPDAARRLSAAGIATVLVVTNCRAAALRGKEIAAACEPTSFVVVKDSERRFSMSQIQRIVGDRDPVMIPTDKALNRWADAGILLDRGKAALPQLRDIGIAVEVADQAPSAGRAESLLG